ncbi:hypothetical protein HMPREF1051_2884 [Neisseria sicca VK64]|uniref:Uncharacterized protein n=1 Tax=Neisseria sicca VK64 TaxID=1095748 RepID=I2NWT1_NEISI|nr:hypothetical protein HMPREF1051_2884 [Neisseria sicca VK64]
MRQGGNARRVRVVHKGVGNAVSLQFSSTIFSDDLLFEYVLCGDKIRRTGRLKRQIIWLCV